MALTKERHAAPRIGELKCIVCGCTDTSACEPPCTWIMEAPPLCSACVKPYVIVKLWKFVFAMEAVDQLTRKQRDELARVARGIRELYGLVEHKDNGMPTLKQIRQIDRVEAKWALAMFGKNRRQRKAVPVT